MGRGLVFIKVGNVKSMQERPVFEDRQALLRIYEERWVDARSATQGGRHGRNALRSCPWNLGR